jgi:hypothetical protein
VLDCGLDRAGTLTRCTERTASGVRKGYSPVPVTRTVDLQNTSGNGKRSRREGIVSNGQVLVSEKVLIGTVHPARPLAKYIKDFEMIEAVRARSRSSGWCPFCALARYMKRTDLLSERVLASGAPPVPPPAGGFRVWEMTEMVRSKVYIVKNGQNEWKARMRTVRPARSPPAEIMV